MSDEELGRVRNKVDEHSSQIGFLQGAVEGIEGNVTRIQDTQKDIFREMKESNKTILDEFGTKFNGRTCMEEPTLAYLKAEAKDHENRLKNVEGDTQKNTITQKVIEGAGKTLHIGWKVAIAIVMAYLAYKQLKG